MIFNRYKSSEFAHIESNAVSISELPESIARIAREINVRGDRFILVANRDETLSYYIFCNEDVVEIRIKG